MCLSDNHFSITSSSDVKSICSLLQVLNLNFFQYMRIYQDGYATVLTTDIAWLKFCTTMEYSLNEIFVGLDSGIYLWTDILELEIVNDAKDYFQIHNVIQFLDEYKTYREIFIFGGGNENNKIISFYLNNLDLLQKFIFFFKGESKYLFEKADRNRILFPCFVKNTSFIKTNHMRKNVSRLNGKYMEQFQMRLHNHLTASLTEQQVTCLYHVIHGKTAKEIAKILRLSYRTVEEHLDNLKNKLHCKTKHELIEAYFKYIVQSKHFLGINI